MTDNVPFDPAYIVNRSYLRELFVALKIKKNLPQFGRTLYVCFPGVKNSLIVKNMGIKDHKGETVFACDAKFFGDIK